MTTTLIIGNGFDLQCGLNSTYTNYFDDKITLEVKELLDKLKRLFKDSSREYAKLILKFDEKNILHKKVQPRVSALVTVERHAYGIYNINPEQLKLLSRLSFWDLIFYFSKESSPTDWYDIERKIQEFSTTLSSLQEAFSKGNFKVNSIFYLCSSIFRSCFPKERYENFTESAFLFLQSELRILEKDFTTYLSKDLSINTHYREKTTELLNKILKLQPGNILKEKLNILTFNYTNPFFKNELLENNFYVKIKNIHGTLNKDNIIFGIDPKEINTKNNAFIFTKTYRQLIGGFTTNKQDLNFNGLYEDNGHTIIFYGHSLSEADYSYFEAIFDKSDLYESSTKLIFTYSIYSEYQREKITLEYIDRITKLLEDYASTLSNKDHKDNLVSRLLLENRLMIEEIPET